MQLKAERRSRALKAQTDNTYAALINEQITRRRVEAVEDWMKAWTAMSFWKRLRWLALGR